MFIACGETFMSRASSALDRPGRMASIRMQMYWGKRQPEGFQHRRRHLGAQRGRHAIQQIAKRLVLEVSLISTILTYINQIDIPGA